MRQSSTRLPTRLLVMLALAVLEAASRPGRVQAAAAGEFQWPDWDALTGRHPGAAAVMLLDETVSELGYFGDAGIGRKVERHRVIAILDPARAAEWLSGEVRDTPVEQLLDFEARMWTSSKRIRRLGRGDLEAGPAPAGGARRGRQARYRFADVPPRSVMDLRIVHIRPSLLSYDEHVFANTIPTRVSRARLLVPRHLVRRELSQWVRAFGSVSPPRSQVLPRPDGEVREFLWEMTDREPLVEEAWMPSRSEVAPTLWIGPLSPESPVAGWDEAARRYFVDVIAPRLVSSGALRDLAQRLVAGHEGWVERLRALHAHVAGQVATLPGGLDFGGFEPRPVEQVLKQGRGDGLEKACLLLALLGEAGVEARLALVRARGGGPADTSFLNLGQFDRALVQVRVGAQPWFLDPAASCPPEYLPAEVQGATALVVGPEGGSFQGTPLLTAERNAIERRVAGSLDAAGGLSGTLELRVTGDHRLALQGAFWEPEERLQRAAAESLLRVALGPATLTGHRVAVPRDASGPLLIGLDFSLAAAVQAAGDTLLLPGDFLRLPDWGTVLGPARVHPIVFPGAEQWSDRMEIAAPPGFDTARPIEAAAAGTCFSLFGFSSADSSRIRFERRLERTCPAVPVAEIGPVRAELGAVEAAYRGPLRFVRRR